MEEGNTLFIFLSDNFMSMDKRKDQKFSLFLDGHDNDPFDL
jgi:hypothetical protein